MDNRRRYEDHDRRRFDDRDHRRFEEEHRFHRYDRERPQKRVKVFKKPFGGPGKTTTKLITSKDELVQYVNELGEKGHHIDVYKIEDDLYKVVVKEPFKMPFNFDEEDFDIDIDIDVEKE